MKTSKFLFVIFLIISQLVVSISLFADEDEYSRKIHREFKVPEGNLLEIINKFGKVVITGEDESNEVVFDIRIVVEADNQEEADEILKNIRVNFDSNSEKISAITQIADKPKRKEFRIDYAVKMPKQMRLRLQNKFGDIFIDELHAWVDIQLGYGTMKINRLTNGKTSPKSSISLAYSKGSIEFANWLKMSIKYSKFSLIKAQALMLISKYSKINITKCSSVVAESKYDSDYRIGTVRNFLCNGKYSDYDIGNLTSKLEIDIKYSGLKVAQVGQNFQQILLNLSYGNADINIDAKANYQLKGTAKYGSISYPSGYKISSITRKNSQSISGFIGSNKLSSARVVLTAKYGNIDID